MILQALYEYYTRKPNSEPLGYEWNRKLNFIIVIDENGIFQNIIEPNDVSFLVPRASKRSGGNFQPNILWDKEEYVLGTFNEEQVKFLLFKKLIQEELPENVKADRQIIAVQKFYENKQIELVKIHPDFELIKKAKNPNITFRLIGETEPVPCIDALKEYITTKELNTNTEKGINANATIKGICAITGEKTIIARTHQKTFINKDANLLVSFQKDSGYDSYGKTQAYNATIGVPAEFAYTSALKTLLEKKENKFTLRGGKKNGTTFLFWSEKQNEFENFFPVFFSFVKTDDPDTNVKSLKVALESIFTGRFYDDGDTQFYILGLCQGGGSRIAIRYWKTATVKVFASNIKQHFEDLSIVSGFDNAGINLYSLLTNTCLKGDLDNLPPNMVGQIVESILDINITYPTTLQQQCIRRIRAEVSEKTNVTRIRAAILKAYLNRKLRMYNTNEKQITMALDLENNNQGYLCGRLFAVLEKIQEEAQPGINATIKERYYGAASSTPVTVFGRLLGLSNHHLVKLNPGRKTNFEKLIQEVMGGISSSGMPSHLSLDDQSRFAIGYYHQRQDFFTKKDINN